MELINKIKLKINSDIHLKELLKGSSIAFILRVVGIIAGYIFTLLITRGYGAEAMGIFALSFTLLQISSVIGRLGMDTALLRFVAEYASQGKWEIIKNIYKKAIKLVLPFSIFISISVFFLSPYIAEFIFRKPHLEPYFKIASIGIVPFVLLFIHSQLLRGLKKITEFMFLQQIGIFLLSSIFLGLFLLFNKKIFGFENINKIPISVYIVSIFIISIIAFLLWKKETIKSQNEAKTIFVKIDNKKLLSLAIPMLFSGSLALLLGWIDTLMLGIFRTEGEVGIYNVVLKVAMLTGISFIAINSIAAPKFATFFGKKDYKKLENVFHQSVKILLTISLPITITLFLFSKVILGIFGEEFQAGLYVLYILVITQIIQSISGLGGMFLSMTGNHIADQNINLFSIIINIFLNYIFINLWGIIGAATATFISLIIRNILLIIFIQRHYKFFIYKIF